MTGSGLAEYAALNARVRVMYSNLLMTQYSRLCEASDLNGLLNLVKSTVYNPYLEKVKDKDMSPRRAVFQMKGHLADAYASITRTAPVATRPLLSHLYQHFEVNNLKAVLRGIAIGASWDRVRFVLFPYGAVSTIPAQAMLEAGNITAAIELLRSTHYYETLSFAMKRFSAEQNLFPLEVALDLHYWRELWDDVKKLTDQDRTQALRVVGSLVDMNNIMWAIRYKVYHHLSEEELINYTLPFGYRVKDEDIRSIAAGGSISHIVERIYPGIRNVDEMLLEPQNGLPELERQIQRHVMKICHNEFLGNPFHIGLPLAYLILSEFEMQDLTVLVEAKSLKIPNEDYRSFLLTTPV